MNASLISAFSALLGATIGGLTSIAASWLTQRSEARTQWIVLDRIRRHELYKDFIEDASRCYIDALQHSEPDLATLSNIYAKINRMRVQSSTAVVEMAEEVAKKIIDAYLAPDKNFFELRELLADGSLDLLIQFSEVCREEFESLRAQQFQVNSH